MRSERRLHRAAVLVGALASARDALLPIALTFVVSGGGSTRAALLAVLGIIGSVAAGAARWAKTSYWVADGALHFRSGVFSPDERVVPLARLTALDEVRGPVQRLFGVVALHAQTAGGGAQGEIVLSAVTQHAVDELRALSPGGAPAPEADSGTTWRLGFGALLLTAVTGPQLSVVLPVVASGVALASQTLEDTDLFDRLPGDVAGWERVGALLAVLVLALALLGAVVGFGGFVAERTGGRLRVHRGYGQRRTASLDVERVHAIRVVEGALRRPLGLCSIRLEVAGYAAEPSVARTLVPLCRRADAAIVLSRLLPELPLPTGPPQRPPPRALRRFILPPLAAGAPLGTAVVLTPVPALLAAVPVLLAAALGVLEYRAAGWWLADGTVAVRSRRLLARTTTVALTRRLQDAVLAASLGQRRATLATVQLAVASKHRAYVRHIAAADAHALFGRLRAAAVTG